MLAHMDLTLFQIFLGDFRVVERSHHARVFGGVQIVVFDEELHVFEAKGEAEEAE